MASVESWDPSAKVLTPRHRDILNHAASQLDAAAIDLTDDDQALLRPVMNFDAGSWRSFVESESDITLVHWAKVLTIIERDMNGFDAGSRSPVLVLVKTLKARNALPTELFAWIKVHTRNRFLPYGSLSDRL